MTHSLSWFPITSRIAAALFGGYAFTWGFVTLLIALGLTLGADLDDSWTLAYLLAFLVYLVAFLWAFAAERLLRVWVVLAGGGGLMTGVARYLTLALN